MSTTIRATHDHPLVAVVQGARESLRSVVDEPVWSLPDAGVGPLLIDLAALKSQVCALELTVLAHAEQVGTGTEAGATSTATWVAHTTRTTRAEAHRAVKTAQSLQQHPATLAALAAGDLRSDQAQVICWALDQLPAQIDDLPLDLKVILKAEQHLIDEAATWDAKHLRILGRRVLEVIAPHLGEAWEAKKLAEEEGDAATAARFSMRPDGHGKVHGRFTISALHAAILTKALHAIAAPKHQAATRGPLGQPLDQPTGPRPGDRRMGEAFSEYIESYPDTSLPQTGGTSATIVVTITLDDLLTDLTDDLTDTDGTGTRAGASAGRARGRGVATLDTGEVITAATARRLACRASIIPAVLGGPSQILDLGRSTRFHNKHQRIALALRDGGCTAEGCDWPPGMCHAHHDQPWSQGGPTDLTHGRLLCPQHHQIAHDPRFTTTHLPGGKVAFTRRE